MSTNITDLRNRILTGRQVRPAKRTKRLIKKSEWPDAFPKTTKMKLLEYRYNVKIEDVIFDGSLAEIVRKFHGDVDRSTICRWRRAIEEINESKFFEQF